MPAVLATPSRTRIFTCRPTAPTQELSCARRILATLARRAYRQPVDERDLRPLIEFYPVGRREGSFETGIQRALRPCWRVPRAFRIERDPEHLPADRAYAISDVELASRLSFFLWSSIPDEELMAAAVNRTLHASGAGPAGPPDAG